uniref:Uncharacterized protein n=1 Tax=Hippocampus comes TaxID=109280 RepID=A0A3Q2YYV7_HIPCM
MAFWFRFYAVNGNVFEKRVLLSVSVVPNGLRFPRVANEILNMLRSFLAKFTRVRPDFVFIGDHLLCRENNRKKKREKPLNVDKNGHFF